MSAQWVQNGTVIDLRARFPDEFHAEATAYARSVGISLNGLLMVALREYLDGRRLMPSSAGSSPAGAPAVAAAVSADLTRVRADAAPAFKAPKNPRAPCPCGSRQQWRHCHGKGKPAA